MLLKVAGRINRRNILFLQGHCRAQLHKIAWQPLLLLSPQHPVSCSAGATDTKLFSMLPRAGLVFPQMGCGLVIQHKCLHFTFSVLHIWESISLEMHRVRLILWESYVLSIWGLGEWYGCATGLAFCLFNQSSMYFISLYYVVSKLFLLQTMLPHAPIIAPTF